MSPRPASLFIAFLSAAVFLAGCSGAFERDRAAARAKTRMIGMTKEEVLACMGPAKKKAREGKTEVWQYQSTDGHRTRFSNSMKITSDYRTSYGTGSKSFCTVNVVMKDNAVTAVNYTGPSSSGVFHDFDQCGYAVAACVDKSPE